MKINRVFIVFWSALLVFSSLNAQSPKDIYSSGILMEGKIGGKYAIQLRLSGDDVHDFFEFKTDECREVRGEYCYLSQMKPLALNGKICPKNETLLLSFYKEGVVAEQFVGKWDAGKRTIAGEWKMLSSNKTLPFALSDLTSRQLGKQDGAVFAQLLKQNLVQQPSDWQGYQYEIESIAWQSANIEIAQFMAADGRIVHLSNNRLEFEHNYSNAGHSTDTYEIFQLLPKTTGYMAIHLIQNSSSESMDEEGDVACDFDIQLWEYQHSRWEEIKDAVAYRVFPENLAQNGFDCDLSIELLPNAIRIDKLFFDWDGQKFVTRTK